MLARSICCSVNDTTAFLTFSLISTFSGFPSVLPSALSSASIALRAEHGLSQGRLCFPSPVPYTREGSRGSPAGDPSEPTSGGLATLMPSSRRSGSAAGGKEKSSIPGASSSPLLGRSGGWQSRWARTEQQLFVGSGESRAL